MNPLKILVACEFSGNIRNAFASLGHTVVSADLEPPNDNPDAFNATDIQTSHYQGDVRDILHHPWDLLIANPPCTYLALSGLHHNKNNPDRAAKTQEALDFALHLFDSPAVNHIPHRGLENSVGKISTAYRKPDQIVQPYNFGHDASKRTCLWLHDLPNLLPTKYIEPLDMDGYKRWGNQTPAGQNKLGPSESRWKLRATTYPGIAQAMAVQWSAHIQSKRD